MNIAHYFKSTIAWATIVAATTYFANPRTSYARGGHGGHEGEHHEAEHHEAEHHEEHRDANPEDAQRREAEHHPNENHNAEHHPFQPTPQHLANHDLNHHDDHPWNHHHHDWQYAGWGWNPGFWGGVGVGYVGANYLGGWGGNTYIDNGTPVATNDNSTPASDNANGIDNNIASGNNSNQVADSSQKYPVDVWPELGISTYSGEYNNTRGLVVVNVTPESAAEKAGLAPGDVILNFDGKATPDEEALDSILDSAHGGFKLLVMDAHTGNTSVINGSLGSGAGAGGEKNPG
ncbi:MAG TPA: PDZ domain-containing protein [Pirellulales bacterium]|nr:PDZ domain-containing protein [Pirellulales bacterium]